MLTLLFATKSPQLIKFIPAPCTAEIFTVMMERKLAVFPLCIASSISISTPPTCAFNGALDDCTASGYWSKSSKAYEAINSSLRNHLRVVCGRSTAEQVKFTSGQVSDKLVVKLGKPRNNKGILTTIKWRTKLIITEKKSSHCNLRGPLIIGNARKQSPAWWDKHLHKYLKCGSLILWWVEFVWASICDSWWVLCTIVDYRNTILLTIRMYVPV